MELEDLNEEDWQEVEFDHYRETQESSSSSSENESENEDDDLNIYSDDEAILSPVSMDIKKLIVKLDGILVLLFKRIQEDIESDPQFYYHLLNIFEKIFLPTHHLRCTQFLIFYASSLNPSYPDDMMGLLVGKILNSNVMPGTRTAATSYLASYVSRAKFTTVESVKTCLSLLVPFCLDFVDKFDQSESKKIVSSKQAVFYAVVQAILYIFCFRWRDLMPVDKAGFMPPELNGIKKIMTSKLAPLKVCSIHIVEEFAKLTHSLNILYCYPFMSGSSSSSSSHHRDPTTPHQEKRTKEVGSSSGVWTKAEVLKTPMELCANVLERLETFFPFDPLTLPLSKRFVQDLYQEWESMEDSDADSGSDETSDDDGDPDSSDVDEIATSLEKSYT
jgi:RNA polymerase I-specific transcription initiation factor RRN3